ncbi:MAG: phosphate uptake regulator PhoU [Methanoregula sp.]|nr:phosphate uptake regulator PhoU [Methanoregula sp.]
MGIFSSWFLPDPVFQPLMALHMAALVTAMIDDVIAAFEKETLEPIKEFFIRDDTVDTHWHLTIRKMRTLLMENPMTLIRSTYCIMVAQYLERSGDHACKMAENDHYMMTGERIKIK